MPDVSPVRVGTSTTTRTTETTTHTGEPMSDHTGTEWTDATFAHCAAAHTTRGAAPAPAPDANHPRTTKGDE
ncbi:hypothetical protein POPTART_62 [Mycobacterium phage PopTart]|uniref:Uncharacterized protein n=1 Tax=Mycobacterium phage PopTart TaxID=1698712 RepID=A0A0K2FNN1_9CAUD|nr:hypothetical protein POPTART_62 [Mycobacterium phage PopTart]ALA48609.1 hypothetical protein POPTART_62 [Mycobacterium phage PopTart]AQY55569.1 hypothetical protein PBI_SassyB_62 [Mycobacterium phage SassyB]